MVWLLLLLPLSGDDDAPAIAFHPTLIEARADEVPSEDGERLPMVVNFHAPWCSWCRKMQVDTFVDPAVTAFADKFLWARIDSEEHPDVAARFEVTGLPDTFVLNGKDQVIASHPGYMPPDQFAAFLTEALENPQPPRVLIGDLLARLSEDQSAEDRRDTLTHIVERLSAPDRQGRQESLEALTQAGQKNWQVLLDLMADERLAIRAAAGGALSRASGAELPFDPFADSAAREQQIEDWREWIVAAERLPAI